MMYLGIDFGTSGSRAVVIDAAQTIQATVNVAIDQPTNWQLWRSSLFDLIEQIPAGLREQVRAIAINGTSSTVLICDAAGEPLAEPLLYSDARGSAVLDRVRSIAPADHTVVSATSSLAKLLWWLHEGAIAPPAYFLHQADWLGFCLHGQLGISDYHNALKLGYDVGDLRYPDWMPDFPIHLPQVVAPGTPIAPVLPDLRDRFGFPPDCHVCAGTTDSIAAFLASGAQFPGEAVTSLGSTLVLKLLSETRVDDTRYGIYSHRYGDLWLVGGASNTGGAVLRQFFTDAELDRLSAQIAIDPPSLLNYYPLLQPGDRFPINDPDLPPRLEPRPADPVEFLHGLLQGIAQIEARGYHLLIELGATPVRSIYTAGGGAKNDVWMQIRSRLLKVPVCRSPQTEAAFGTALLALRSRLSAEED
ncbi:FGGY-family carbohydrate kinase [Microcoleus sp. FACHB-1515]|uniref:FGGY-family carbohydrate kinase n=1 Tax=Cyanophyceae TaxID=3028117 RepID=UPI0016864C40|nr:FGGY-family carbohydrate kinase [Microcoleus sp. FACHB-1515]MBD2091467.1 FGGY-family carbohydrate kinase [Microcoleus sp. FACHB-1515]